MKIIHVVTRREFRGAEVVAADLCERFVGRGHRASMVGLYRPILDKNGRGLQRVGVPTVDLNGARKGYPDPFLLRRLARLLQEHNPDLVQANAFHALKFSVAARRILKARWPIVYRNVGIASEWLRYPGQRWWGRLFVRHADHVLSVSEASKQDFQDTYGVPAGRISICRQGVDIPQQNVNSVIREELAELCGVSPQRPMIGHIANFSAEKNHLGLMEAMTTIVGRHPNALLVLWGDGVMRETIEEEIQRRQLMNSVVLLGARDDARRLIGGVDLNVITSHVEGIPGAVLEASAMGIPTVATRVGGIAEVIMEGKSGFMVTAGNMAEFADRVCELLSSARERKIFGETARQFVSERHNMEDNVHSLEKLYESLIHD
ncbi:MAG: glycosyltransferase [Pirellulaceae bacterium]|nr:glycosyltransferase [Pirellulaceae bacterium]